MPRNTIHAEVDRPMKSALQRVAQVKKVSTSVVVRWALQEYLDRQTKETQAA